MVSDPELLHRYADDADEAAFADLVRRHTDLVYSIAVRMTGDAALAQDITQTVFTKLARQARRLGGYCTLVGWLHTTTRFSAINAIQSEARRRAREQEAFAMQNDQLAPNASWDEIRPLLDEAVGRLRESDREAVMLRFFNGLSHREVGDVLGFSENSANKRIERALEKLRAHFVRRGVTTTASMLAAAISANSIQAAPVGLAAKVIPASLSGMGGTAGGGVFFLHFFMSTKAKISLAVIVLAIVVLGIVFKFRHEPGPLAATPSNAGLAPKIAALVDTPTAPRVTVPISASKTTGMEAAAPPPPTNDPQAELSTAIPDLMDLLKNGEFRTLMKRYMKPSDYEKLAANPGSVPLEQYLEQEEMKARAQPNPTPGRLQILQLYQVMLNQQPTLNRTGDRATYHLSGFENLRVAPPEVDFVKIDGKWYLDVSGNALYGL